jgi:hypothetical protein
VEIDQLIELRDALEQRLIELDAAITEYAWGMYQAGKLYELGSAGMSLDVLNQHALTKQAHGVITREIARVEGSPPWLEGW